MALGKQELDWLVAGSEFDQPSSCELIADGRVRFALSDESLTAVTMAIEHAIDDLIKDRDNPTPEWTHYLDQLSAEARAESISEQDERLRHLQVLYVHFATMARLANARAVLGSDKVEDGEYELDVVRELAEANKWPMVKTSTKPSSPN